MVSHIIRVEENPLEDVLAKSLGTKFGDRFLEYRKNFFRTLNADKDGYVPDFPLTVTIELLNRCNLTCVMCYTENHRLPKATLTLDEIQRIFDETSEHDGPAVLLGMGSEAMIYKDIGEVLDIAKDSQVMDLFFLTNGTLLNEKIAERLVDSGVARVMISLDAVTPETFEKIRGKNQLAMIEKNVEKLLEIRDRKGSELPVVRLSFCVQPLNAHEREAFEEKWKGKVDFLDFQVLQDFSMVDQMGGDEMLDDQTRQAIDAMTKEEAFCHHFFGYLNIWSNGDITPCCTYYGKNLVFGNIRETTLAEVWNGENMEALRRQFLSGKINDNCKVCMLKREHKTMELAFSEPAE